MGVAALADAAIGGGEAAVADAALTEAAGATTLADGSIITAGGTALPAATAVDAATAATGATTIDGSSVVADSSSATGFSANGEPVNMDGTPYTGSASPTVSADTGSGLNLNSVTNPNYTSMGLNPQGAVPGLSSMGGASGLTLPESTVLGDPTATGTLSASGVTAANASPILCTQIKPLSGLPSMPKLPKMPNIPQQKQQQQQQPYTPATATSNTTNNYGGSSVSTPLSLTPMFTGAPSSSTGTFLSPLSSAGLSASQLNQLYTPSGLGDTTTPNLISGSAEPSGGIFPVQQWYTGFAKGGLAHAHKPEFMTGVTGHYAQGSGTGQSDDIPAVLKDGDYVMDADIVAALGDGSSKAGAEALHHFMNQFPHKHYENHSEGGHINAMIADGEFVFPASLVTALGGGSNKDGAKKLDEMREKIREHKRSASTNKIPPKAKSPLTYIEGK